MNPAFEEIMSIRGRGMPEDGEVTIKGHDPVFAARFKIGETTANILAGVGKGVMGIKLEEGTNRFRYGSGEQAWNLWVNHYGPSRSLAANLDDARREEFKRDMIAWHETFASELGYDQPRQYLITRGIRK